MTLPGEDILAQAAQRFGIDPHTITFVRDAANAIYEFTQGSQSYILRLTPGSQRDRSMILGEMDWMDYLAAHGGHVPKVVRSTDGRLVETLETSDSTFYGVVFEKVGGVHPTGARLTDDVLRKWGQTLGNMHRLSRDYRPSHPSIKRPHWHELDVFQLEARIPDSQPIIRGKCREMLDYLRHLPIDRDSYGLIHADPEPWNFFLHQGEITFIDFDDCCYHWFAFDVAVSIMYAVLAAETGDDAFAQHAWRCFDQGYRQENRLSPFWIGQVPVFLKLRVMEDYAFSLATWDMNNLEDWQKNMLGGLRHAIETGTPFPNITF